MKRHHDTPRTDAVLNTFNGVASKLADDLATHSEILERELSAEQALTDRLGNWMADYRKDWGGMKTDAGCNCEDCSHLIPLDELIAAWKEARR